MSARDDDEALLALKAKYPGWDIRRTMNGYLAVPAGTVVLGGMFLETLEEKLAEREGRDTE